MNSRQIEIYAAVMKCGTVSRAAEVLGVTQPGISRMIATLEQSLGFSLFDRVRNRIIPTPEGKMFYAEVAASFRGMETLRAAAARIRDHGEGQLRIGSLSALASSLVPKAMRRFRDKRPDTSVTLMVLPSRDVRDGVVSGAFDVGLAADSVDLEGVLHQPFTSPCMLCAIPRDHPLAGREVIRPSDLSDIPFIAHVPEDRARQRLEAAFVEAKIRPRIVVETIYGATVCGLVAEGVGVGLVNPYAAAEAHSAKVVLRPFEPAVRAKSLLLLPIDRPKSQIVRDLIDCLMAAR